MGDAARVLGEDFVYGLNESIGDSIYAAFTGDLDSIGDIWDGFLNSLLRSVSDFLGQLASQALLGGLGAIFQGIGGTIFGGIGNALVGAVGGNGVGSVATSAGTSLAGKALGGVGGAAMTYVGNGLWQMGATKIGGALINAGTTSTVTTFTGAEIGRAHV